MADDKTTNPAPAEASADEATVAAAAAKASGDKKKKLLLLGSGALAVVGILVAVGFLFVFGKEKPEEKAEDAAAKVPQLAIYDVPTITVNLLTDEATSGPRYLKVTLALELENATDSEAAAALLPRLQDDWGSYLRQLRPADLQGSGAMQSLREGLLRRAIQTMQPVQVKAVLLRDILVQ